ncbi:hypothetical protein [Chelatococcus reniformis]|uniref:Acetyltransferase n=1 Tax=Chelatococcus reniformis TaxID=1494448 RepID=A0A916UWG0_9HYPH|nr:hypothetical protein [Chelatococcus reniformis]GGC91331.1 hypothetical protein GCM10010994_56350 [Chelatococcus reniformis]
MMTEPQAELLSNSPAWYADPALPGGLEFLDDLGVNPHARLPVPLKVEPVSVGHDVRIGEAALLKCGVCIGDGALIFPRTVVTNNVPPYAIVAGNPGEIIDFRFPERIVERLLEARWWRYHFHAIQELGPENVPAFLDRLELAIADRAVREFTPGALIGAAVIGSSCCDRYD